MIIKLWKKLREKAFSGNFRTYKIILNEKHI